MIEEWKSALHNGNMVGSIAIDLSRAFDSLPHGLLLAKIYAYGVNIESCKLIAIYLLRRHHRVEIRDKRSDWLPIERGVPQGSIMGPLLLNIFISDIFFINSDINIYDYADGNCISFVGSSIDTIADTLNKEMVSLMEWFRKNSLAANPAKFQTMHVKSNNIKDAELNVTVDNVSLPSSDAMKVLGIDIDDRLTFDGHHRVEIRDKRSDWLPIERGVPQGSIMGPLLLNIFISDIFFINSDINIYDYADGNCISFVGSSIDTIADTLNKEMVSLMEWFRKNSLAANPAKFQTMHVKSNNIKDAELNVTVDNVSLPSSDAMKVLGIDIDDRLTFDGHVSNMYIKAGELNALQRLKGSLDRNSCMAIYKSFSMSNFNYCPLVWMFTSKTALSKLENIQKRALKFVFSMIINRAILSCCRTLTFSESKSWSYDIWLLKCLNVLRN